MDTSQTNFYIAVIIASVIIGIIIAIFFISLIRHQRKLLEFHRLSILSEVTTLENERSRIAADMHDELAPMIYLVKYQVNSVEIENAEDKEILQKSVTVLENIAERVRGISKNLLPSALTRKGLLQALEEYVSDLNESSPLEIHLEHAIHSNIHPDISINTFRIIQEITQNVLKHADAKKLLIIIKEVKGKLEVICEDNGKGFDHKKLVEAHAGLGLQNINSRTQIMKGEVSVTSEKGKGTQYLIKIPITN